MTRVLGPDHPDTLTSHANFAVALRDLGRLAEAEAEIRAVVDTRNRVLGLDHPDTLTLTSVLSDLGQAESLRRPAPATGKDHGPALRAST